MSENIMKRLKVLTKAQFLELPEIDANVRYFITDMPENQIDNADMALAITTEAALYNAGDIFICKDTDTYEKGHIYQLNSTKDAWEDITPASGSSTIIGATDPTTSTVGTVGQFYLNATTGKLFICKSITSGSPDAYEWGTPSNLIDTSSASVAMAGGEKILIYPEMNESGFTLSWPNNLRQVHYSAVNVTVRNAVTGDAMKLIYYGLARGNYEMNAPRKTGTLALLENIAPSFSSSTAYSVGDLVTHSSSANEPAKLYKCTTNHTGAWNASHFTEVTLADMLSASAGGSGTQLYLHTITFSAGMPDPDVDDTILYIIRTTDTPLTISDVVSSINSSSTIKARIYYQTETYDIVGVDNSTQIFYFNTVNADIETYSVDDLSWTATDTVTAL